MGSISNQGFPNLAALADPGDTDRSLPQTLAFMTVFQARRAHQLAAGLMDASDIDRVKALARMVPAGGTVVDVGSLLGMSASLWCMESQAARVVCIDRWEYAPWMESFAANNGGEISKDVFLRNVPDDRIEAIQGSSPECVRGWFAPVDLYWDDSDHTNAGFLRNLDFWCRHVRPGGIVCGHDVHWRVVETETEALAAEWGVTVQRLGTTVWWFRKPDAAPARRRLRAPWWLRRLRGILLPDIQKL